jgi:hypothetical protein
MSDFQKALEKLVNDGHYRASVAKDPAHLTRDFKGLKAADVLVLMQTWLASGHPGAEASILTICHCCSSTHA